MLAEKEQQTQKLSIQPSKVLSPRRPDSKHHPLQSCPSMGASAMNQGPDICSQSHEVSAH